MMAPAFSFTSSIVFASFTPPPLPRPPAWICAFTHPELGAGLAAQLLGLFHGLIGVVSHQPALHGTP
jgi:hypothetical protein